MNFPADPELRDSRATGTRRATARWSRRGCRSGTSSDWTWCFRRRNGAIARSTTATTCSWRDSAIATASEWAFGRRRAKGNAASSPAMRAKARKSAPKKVPRSQPTTIAPTTRSAIGPRRSGRSSVVNLRPGKPPGREDSPATVAVGGFVSATHSVGSAAPDRAASPEREYVRTPRGLSVSVQCGQPLVCPPQGA